MNQIITDSVNFITYLGVFFCLGIMAKIIIDFINGK